MRLHYALPFFLLPCFANIIPGRRALQAAPSLSITTDLTDGNTVTSDRSLDGAAARLTGGLKTIAWTHPVKRANVDNKTPPSNGKLPIQPEITPALGIAGIILIFTGLAYAFIATKHESVGAFLSPAYLASLAVTVLVLHFTRQPVSDAVQGASLVAVTVSGLLFGAVSFRFQEVCLGLACSLGGFCFSMWILVLRPGGLVSSTAGKAIMIVLFTVAAWPISFSKHTRTYGLVFFTSFAGATATLLGVDCFSRAGLKEFWVYIWNLNKNEFPARTTSYPITKGMLAEIVCIIALFLLGLAFQLEVWDLLKFTKAKEVELPQYVEWHGDEQDSYLAHGIESNKRSSITVMESGPDNNTPATSPFESVYVGYFVGGRKKSVRMTQRGGESMELQSLSGSLRNDKKHNWTANVQPADVAYDNASSVITITDTPAERDEFTATQSSLEDLGKSNSDESPASSEQNEYPETQIFQEIALPEADDQALLKPVPQTPNTHRIPRKPVARSAPDQRQCTAENSKDGVSVPEALNRPKKLVRRSMPNMTHASTFESATRVPHAGQRAPSGNESQRYLNTRRSSFQRRRKSASSFQPRRGARSASMPLIQQTLVESPIEEDLELDGTLLKQRNDRIHNRPTAVNFNSLTSASTGRLFDRSESASNNEECEAADDTDMTLSERRRLIQQGRIRIPSDRSSIRSARSSVYSGRSSHSERDVSPISIASTAATTSTTAQQAATLSQWRRSLQQEQSNDSILMAERYAHLAPYAEYSPFAQYGRQAHQSMAEQLRYQDYQQQKRQVERRNQESMEEMAMRTGQMTSLHRSALSRMQKQANDALKWETM